jgi:hypothetical protein
LDVAVPAELKPALKFQQVFLKILANPIPKELVGEANPDWVADLRVLVAGDRPEDGIAHGVAEVSRLWLARAHILTVEASLAQYYRHHVRFPDQLSEIVLPEAVRRDPWGGPWAYKTKAPEGFAKLAGQRFEIGPTRYPALGGLPSGDRNLTIPPWKIALRQVANKPALEFRSPSGAAAVLQPGGQTGDYTLLYIGNHWALMASPDQLFSVRFPN